MLFRAWSLRAYGFLAWRYVRWTTPSAHQIDLDDRRQDGEHAAVALCSPSRRARCRYRCAGARPGLWASLAGMCAASSLACSTKVATAMVERSAALRAAPTTRTRSRCAAAWRGCPCAMHGEGAPAVARPDQRLP